MSDTPLLRPITRADNPAIAALIRDVLTEFGANRPGFAWADPQLDNLFEFYQQANSRYLVVEQDGELLGGAGIAPLDGDIPSIQGQPQTCELQKMYLLPAARGKGLGDKLISALLQQAELFGYSQCYLETMGSMSQARSLYLKHGFEQEQLPLGDTGHGGCDVFLLKRF